MPPKGFSAGACASGMRYSNRMDLGLIRADSFCSGAAVFTQSLCQAAPVIWSKDRFRKGRAVLANAGQANAQTGEKGLRDAKDSAHALGRLLGIPPDEVLLASTGVIGAPMNMEKLHKALPVLTESLRPDGFGDFAASILTTDTAPKTAEAKIEAAGTEASVWGCCKGSGMIAPNMATMLAFVLTDLKVEGAALEALLRAGCEKSFNRITVDGDTSTNDCLFLMSSGLAGSGPVQGPGSPLYEPFRTALEAVLESLARAIVSDGEGATKFVAISVKGARNDAEARLAARTVAESPLCKTAFFGSDPNWGRILAALGRSGAIFDPYQVDLNLDSVPWVRKGVDNGREKEAAAVMRQKSWTITAHLHNGASEHTILTTDLSHKYIDINASYRS